MPDVIIDANVVLDARNSNAKRHDIAAEIFNGVDRGDLPRARLVNYVVPEILHPIQKRISKSAATETLDLLQESRGFEFVHIPKGIHPKGEQLFRLHEPSGPEWVDSVIAAYMLSNDIEYIYSFDDDFDAFDGITRLNTATDPFAP